MNNNQGRTNTIKNKVLTSFLLLIAVIPVFVLSVFGMDYKIYGIFLVVLIVLTILSVKINKEIFATILFFALIHTSRPANDWFTGLIKMNFPGTYFLIPIALFTILILIFKKIKGNISWWTKDKIDTNSVLLIIGLALVSGLSLFIWGKFIAKDLTGFIRFIPDVPLIWIIIYGIGFALLNSIAEEYLSRGMLCNGLEKIFSDKWLIITIQTIVFSIFHYRGFPGGLIGMTMVFAWSVVLGILRYRTKGLAGVLIGHFFADLTIFFILYELK